MVSINPEEKDQRKRKPEQKTDMRGADGAERAGEFPLHGIARRLAGRRGIRVKTAQATGVRSCGDHRVGMCRQTAVAGRRGQCAVVRGCRALHPAPERGGSPRSGGVGSYLKTAPHPSARFARVHPPRFAGRSSPRLLSQHHVVHVSIRRELPSVGKQIVDHPALVRGPQIRHGSIADLQLVRAQELVPVDACRAAASAAHIPRRRSPARSPSACG